MATAAGSAPSGGMEGVGGMMSTTGGAPLSQHTRDKANKTRFALESYYSQFLAQHAERELRNKKLEEVMAAEGSGYIDLNFYFELRTLA